MTVNGEIYNHLAIREQLKGEYEFQTGSDCEVILALLEKRRNIIMRNYFINYLALMLSY